MKEEKTEVKAIRSKYWNELQKLADHSRLPQFLLWQFREQNFKP